MKRIRPDWVPKDAVDWGWKAITHDRKSLYAPELRRSGCQEEIIGYILAGRSQGNILSYPAGTLVKANKFCGCKYTSCYGIHYIRTSNDVRHWLRVGIPREDLINLIVRCYVPHGSEHIKLNGWLWGRASQIITLEAVDTNEKQFQRSEDDHILEG